LAQPGEKSHDGLRLAPDVGWASVGKTP